MKNYYSTVIPLLLFTLFSCNKSSEKLEIDHVNIWVENPKEAQAKLVKLGFTIVPDSLSQVHHGQGTAGKYFNFLNGYLELIFVHDSIEFQQNINKNQSLDFSERANHEKNNASPFSIALKMKDYDLGEIPFPKIPYHQDWMEKDRKIYAAITSKTHLKEPSIFVVYPELEAVNFESTVALKDIQSGDDTWKTLFKHSNGTEKITAVKITSPNIDMTTETMKTLGNLVTLKVKSGDEHLMELYFDNQAQGKSFDLRPELPLIVHL